jgi:hypothetical protein
MFKKILGLFAISFFLSSPVIAANEAAHVDVQNNQLLIDGEAQPQLFGAEVQYFRLRGEYGPNVPRAKVIALWNKALDRVVEAKMNSISFYIPWDFHEYADGKFDFTGTADEDGDGQPDYPSRDIVTFLKLAAEHGIKRILVRPGPFINAEWGFLGFGAIPEWFHQKYPDSHMQSWWGWRSGLYDYDDPDLLHHTQIWLETLYNQVLKDQMGPGKPIVFLQIDNETNFQWQPIYTGDYGPRAIARYQEFLQTTYGSLDAVNRAHGRSWANWQDIKAPTEYGKNLAEDQDWYRNADQTIYRYLNKIRQIWEQIGVHEPQVLFTLAESYNASENGLLPNDALIGSPFRSGLVTVNLYPKTAETTNHAILNNPFKADIDVKSAESANAAYFGANQEWAMGPEIQGGWWRGIDVSLEARQQTFLTVIGHGLKSFFVYYFNEGFNRDVEWRFDRVKPLFDDLRSEWHVENIAPKDLTNAFWGELQARSDRLVIMGIDVRTLMQTDAHSLEKLFFDAPLDEDANPRPNYFQLKKIGEHVIQPYGDFLGRALEIYDDIAIIKDSASHVPSPIPLINAATANSDWMGGLMGYLMNASVNPHILHGDISKETEFAGKTLAHLDTGHSAARTLDILRTAVDRGQGVINFLANETPCELGIQKTDCGKAAELPAPTARGAANMQSLLFYVDANGELKSGPGPGVQELHMSSSNPVFTYELKDPRCEGILLSQQSQVVGYRCHTAAKGTFFQVGALLFDQYNSGDYGQLPEPTEHQAFVNAMLKEFRVKKNFELSNDSVRTVAFARKDPKKQVLWITVKTGNTTAQSLHLKVDASLLSSNLLSRSDYHVKDLITDQTQTISRDELVNKGFRIELPANGSTVFVITP